MKSVDRFGAEKKNSIFKLIYDFECKILFQIERIERKKTVAEKLVETNY